MVVLLLTGRAARTGVGSLSGLAFSRIQSIIRALGALAHARKLVAHRETVAALLRRGPAGAGGLCVLCDQQDQPTCWKLGWTLQTESRPEQPRPLSRF